MTSFLFVFLAVASRTVFPQEFYGNPTGVEGFNKTKIGRALSAHNPWIENSLKSKKELDEYFRCHIAGDQKGSRRKKAVARLQEFNSIYKPLIELAVQHYQVPYALATCTLFRETLFTNKNNKSSGARGMAQIMPETYKEILKDMGESIPGKVRVRRYKGGKFVGMATIPSYQSDYEDYLQITKDFNPENPKNR